MLSDRVLVVDMKSPGVGIGAVNGRLETYTAYVSRTDASSFVQVGRVSRIEYKVLPDKKTMTVRQEPYIDNGFDRELVYEKVDNISLMAEGPLF